MPLGGNLGWNPVSGDKLVVSGGGPRRNVRTQEEICKIWSPNNGIYVFLETRNLRFSFKIIENSRVDPFSSKILKNRLAGSGLPEPGRRPEAGCRNPVSADREPRRKRCSNISAPGRWRPRRVRLRRSDSEVTPSLTLSALTLHASL